MYKSSCNKLTYPNKGRVLRQFGHALAAHCGESVPFRFEHWDEAIARLMRIATNGPTVAVIDEFPFLAKASPALPSIVQRALDPAARRGNTPVRLLLCGSALSFMGRLLAGDAPLRGRAGLELVVPTLEYRLAARFWDITDPRTAALTHAVVGGTPACRREFTQGDAPSGPEDFDDWVVRAVLTPGRPLFREARYLLAENPNSATPPSITPYWRPSPPATRPAAEPPTTWAASRRISPIPSTYSKTSA